MAFKLQLPKWLLEATAKMYISSKPLWFQWNPAHHKIKGYETRQVIDCVKPGDILLRTFHGFVNTMATPGEYGHAAMVVDHKTIIHAVGEGVATEDIFDFCRCDSICLLRLKNITMDEQVAAVNRALKMKEEHVQYDYDFATEQEEKIKKVGLSVYCSEACHLWHNRAFLDDYRIIAGNNILTPTALRTSSKVDCIIEFLHKKGSR